MFIFVVNSSPLIQGKGPFIRQSHRRLCGRQHSRPGQLV